MTKDPQKQPTFQECIYYLAREDFNYDNGHLDYREKEKFFEGALAEIKASGLPEGMRPIELMVLIEAAKRRRRLGELDRAVKHHHRNTTRGKRK
jgi:hypothetical protein